MSLYITKFRNLYITICHSMTRHVFRVDARLTCSPRCFDLGGHTVVFAQHHGTQPFLCSVKECDRDIGIFHRRDVLLASRGRPGWDDVA